MHDHDVSDLRKELKKKWNLSISTKDIQVIFENNILKGFESLDFFQTSIDNPIHIILPSQIDDNFYHSEKNIYGIM